ncbi:hypothetical protein EV356DRAFT_157441 [Viridothelium virens]|uniref:BHLH domain-containing protein n=1 Tax=Viridothelium virens TaxID=1048519 RepID=A0A6A6H887_VIRVR|nr:hypothetical protein EV356DRAFT_157441 [Viridothelium virens]
MNNTSDLSWPQSEQQFEPMIPTGDEELSNLLNLDLDINFPTFESNVESSQNHVQSAEGAHNAHTQQQQFQANRAATENVYRQEQLAHMQDTHSRLANGMRHQQHMHGMAELPPTSNGFAPMNIQASYSHQQQPHPHQFHEGQGLPFQQHQQTLPHHHFVPPTPNSMELQGDREKYLARVDPNALDHRYQLRHNDPMSFTPLVSPAVTPHEANFQIPPEFTVPGAYFSPLSSPMLEAQRNSQRTVTSNPRHTASPATTSPVDPDVDMQDESIGEPAKKLRKKVSNPGPRSVANAARARQSPISKGQRKRGAISGSNATKDVSCMLSDSQRTKVISNRPSSAAGLTPGPTQDSSEADSVSPEPLTEFAMRPPPKPNSKTQSPAILPQSQTGAPSLSDGSLGSPATPASLMRIQQQQQVDTTGGALLPTSSATGGVQPAQQSQPSLEDFALPEAASNTRPLLHSLNTLALPAEDQATPRVSAREVQGSGNVTVSTPTAVTSGISAKPSPRSSAIRSPTAPPGSSGSGSKIDSKGGRSNKKRNSTGSALVSPALRPKISPSIKPLLPEGVNVTDEHHALLLASKSNYQNLIDGTRLPGVNYPQELSTNLTSKRTSHKIAEQGRRNRINTALQEMQSLLPSPQIAPKDGSSSAKDDSKSPVDGGADSGSAGGGKASGSSAAQATAQSNSKAATVESAIEYIKQLKREAEQRDQEIEDLRRQLGQASPGAGGGPGSASTKVA